MSDIQEIFNQYLDRAEALLAEGRMKDAHAACQQVLENDPENTRGLLIRDRIRETVENFNLRTIDEKLDSLKPLWEEGAYEQLVKELTNLYHYAPNYNKLERALADAQALYRTAYNSEKSHKTEGYELELNQLFEEKKYDELLKKIWENGKDAARDTAIQRLHQRFRARLIQAKIQEKKSLFESEKYEDVINFLHQLLDIDSSSELLADLLRTYREKLLASQIENKSEFILRATENAKTLYQIGKYEKAMQVADEILHINPKDAQALSIYSRAKSAFERLIRDQTEDQIRQAAVSNLDPGTSSEPRIRL